VKPLWWLTYRRDGKFVGAEPSERRDRFMSDDSTRFVGTIPADYDRLEPFMFAGHAGHRHPHAAYA
jgi:hypothetical protein